MARKAATKKAKRKTLSPADKASAQLKRLHIKAVRRILSTVGFRRMTGVADKQFTFDNQTTDVDDVYVFENVVVVVEYTTAQSANIGGHLKGKKLFYDKILANPIEFIKFLKISYPEVADQLPIAYHGSQIILKVLYCSRHEFEETYQTNVPGPAYLNYPAVQYFTHVVGAIKRSARFEFLHFMGIPFDKVGKAGAIAVSAPSRDFKGSILPEAHSNFDDGYKVVSFYADADILLRTSYVMRKDGWRNSDNLYQRMISKSKIERLRTYLKKQKRVFINNIIVTLPSSVRPLNEEKKTVDAVALTHTAPVTIQLPEQANTVGIVDGQHRVFAYHETEVDDPDIAHLRAQQNLLVTGIIYPENLNAPDREKFEARLFLEINSNQTSAKAPLKQAIGMVIDPTSTDSIATRIINGLAKQGPLTGLVQQHFWDTDKLKTASIVNYGLKPLVKMSGNDSLFHLWQRADKANVTSGKDDAALRDYIDFCITTINIVLSAIKVNLPPEKWTADKKVPGRVISTTYINSFLIVIRLLIAKDTPLTFDFLKKRLTNLDRFAFANYRSSQYRRMAEKIVETHFDTLPAIASASRQPRR